MGPFLLNMITQAKFILIFSTLLAPLCLAANYYIKKPRLVNFLNIIFPIAFLSSLIAIYSKSVGAKFSLNLISIFDHTLLAFIVDNISYLFLSAVGVIWIILNFYFKKIFVITNDENWQKHYQFFLAAISSIIFVIISKNLLTISLFLALNFAIIHYFIYKFFDIENSKNSHFFIILSAVQGLILLVCALISYHFDLSFDFLYKSHGLGDEIGATDLSLLLILYFIALFGGLILPFYLFFYRNLNFELKTVYIVFFLLSLAPALFAFARILHSLFAGQNLEIIFNSNLFLIFKFFILLLIGFFGAALLLNKSIKTAFFYIFLQQGLFCAFSLIFFARYNQNKAFLPLIALFLEFSLLFLTIGNLSVYLQQAKQKNFTSLFSQLTISCALMVFALFSLSGLAPSLGMVSKFYLFKNAASQGDIILLLIFLTNTISLLLFFAISLRTIFAKTEENPLESDIELAKNLDLDSSTMFGVMSLSLALFVGLVAFPWL